MACNEALHVRQDVLLAPYTTMGVGGPARYFAEATAEDQVLAALEFASNRSLPLFVLGGGSNVLVSDSGFAGLVLRILLQGIQFSRLEGGIVSASAGEDWDSFVHACVARNLAGIECLSGIPGTVGGTPVQNVGAYGQEVSEVILSVRALDRSSRTTVELNNSQCGFGYRSSLFNASERDRYIVLAVTYRLQPGGRPRIAYEDLVRHFDGQGSDATLADVRAAVLQIRAAKGMVLAAGDPDCRSVGSFFKNPIVSQDEASRVEEAARLAGLLAPGASIPRFRASGGMIKLPAAWLIERAGFPKGYARGRTGLSSKHALALINRGDATAGDVLELMREIQDTVRRLFDIDLLPEPVFVGF